MDSTIERYIEGLHDANKVVRRRALTSLYKEFQKLEVWTFEIVVVFTIIWSFYTYF